jgi:hypothetical protein
MRWKSGALDDIPRPTDHVFASVHGEPTLETVVLGNGSITGWGVASHQVGFVGGLARALAHRFARGVAVRGTIDPDLRVPTMRLAAQTLPWHRAQIGVLSFGVMEIHDSMSARAWQRDLTSLIDDLRSRMPLGSVLIVLGIPPLGTLPFLRGIGNRVLDRLIQRYNAKAVEVCSERAGVQFVRLDDPGLPPEGQYRSSAHYALWAEVVAAHVALDPTVVEFQSSATELRSQAVERFAILADSPDDERFDRVVRRAQSVFRTTSAAFTVLHNSLQWYKAKVGVDVDLNNIPREQSVSNLVVSRAGPLVIGDTWSDPRFDDNPALRRGAGIRFYAGYPLRSPDGHYIGALCVFDPEPRNPDDVNVATLRDLALMIEEALEQSARSMKETARESATLNRKPGQRS